MQSDYILLVCPDEQNSSLLKQTGQLALALLGKNKKIIILSQTQADKSLLKQLPTPVYTTPNFSHKILNILPFDGFVESLKKIISEHGEPKVIQCMEISPRILPLYKFCRKKRIPYTGILKDPSALNSKNLNIFERPSYEHMLNHMTPLIVQTPYLLDLCRDQHLQVTYIPEGIAIEQFKPVLSKRPVRRSLELNESGTLVCCMAHIHPDNKQIELLELCNPLHDYLRIVFLGAVKDPDYMDDLRRKALELDIEDYIYYRNSADEPEKYLQASDVFMLLGGVSERQTTALEALCCGLPLVLGSSPLSHFLTDGEKRGFIWQKDKPQKAKIEKILNDPGYRQGRTSYSKEIRKEHALKSMAEAYIAIYDTL